MKKSICTYYADEFSCWGLGNHSVLSLFSLSLDLECLKVIGGNELVDLGRQRLKKSLKVQYTKLWSSFYRKRTFIRYQLVRRD